MRHFFKYVSAQEALQLIQSGDRIFVHGSACTPQFLLQELARQKDRLQRVEVISISLQGKVELAQAGFEDSFHINSLFVSEPVRQAVADGRADFIPAFSEGPPTTGFTIAMVSFNI
jgi:acyl-CoA hydrolase